MRSLRRQGSAKVCSFTIFTVNPVSTSSLPNTAPDSLLSNLTPGFQRPGLFPILNCRERSLRPNARSCAGTLICSCFLREREAGAPAKTLKTSSQTQHCTMKSGQNFLQDRFCRIPFQLKMLQRSADFWTWPEKILPWRFLKTEWYCLPKRPVSAPSTGQGRMPRFATNWSASL